MAWTWRRTGTVTFSGLLFAIYLVAMVFAPGMPAHLLFLTDKVEATVTEAAEGTCTRRGQDRPERHYQLSWQQDGHTETGKLVTCGEGDAYAAGEHLAVWVGSDDRIHTWSPLLFHVGVVITSLVVTCLTALIAKRMRR
jgi:hypothetical protein